MKKLYRVLTEKDFDKNSDKVFHIIGTTSIDTTYGNLIEHNSDLLDKKASYVGRSSTGVDVFCIEEI